MSLGFIEAEIKKWLHMVRKLSIFIVSTFKVSIMKIQVQKWGNSLAVRIPKSFAQETNIDQGSVVDLVLEEGEIVIKPKPESTYTLDELLSQVTKKNIHDEIDTGDAQGKEAW